MANLGLAWGWRVLSPAWQGMWGGAATTEINARMLAVCNAMKSEGIIIFAITFRLSNTSTQDLYRSCSTSPAHYFDSPRMTTCRMFSERSATS